MLAATAMKLTAAPTTTAAPLARSARVSALRPSRAVRVSAKVPLEVLVGFESLKQLLVLIAPRFVGRPDGGWRESCRQGLSEMPSLFGLQSNNDKNSYTTDPGMPAFTRRR
jgi:hypothetical protein